MGPFRPSPMYTAYLFWEWDPRTDSPGKFDVPLSDAFAITPWPSSKDRNSAIGIHSGDIPSYARIYGYVASLAPPPSENSKTGYRIGSIFKMPYLYTGHSEAQNGLSHVFGRIRTYASNALFTAPTAVILGDIVCGVTAANYGGGGLSYLWVWKLSGVTEWTRMAPETFIAPHEFDCTDWVVEWLPCLGGFGFAVDEPDMNRALGARLLPPGDDPHIFVLNRRERLNKAGEDAEKSGQHQPPRPERKIHFSDANKTYVRPRRGRSMSRPRSSAP